MDWDDEEWKGAWDVLHDWGRDNLGWILFYFIEDSSER